MVTLDPSGGSVDSKFKRMKANVNAKDGKILKHKNYLVKDLQYTNLPRKIFQPKPTSW